MPTGAEASRARGPRPIQRFPEPRACTRRQERWTLRVPGFESRHSCSGADDARAGEAIVKSAMVAAEECGQESKTRRRRQHKPHELANERAAQIERGRIG